MTHVVQTSINKKCISFKYISQGMYIALLWEWICIHKYHKVCFWVASHDVLQPELTLPRNAKVKSSDILRDLLTLTRSAEGLQGFSLLYH